MTAAELQLGCRLIALRTARGFTQDRVAAETGFTKGYLSKIENSKVIPSIGTLYPDEMAPLEKPPAYSPYVGKNYPMQLLWGDTHLHTANSIDAAAFGTTLGPEEAYRFARG